MRWCLQPFEPSAYIPGIRLVHSEVCARVRFAGAVEDGLGFSGAIRLPDFLDVQNRQHDALGIT